MYKIPMNVPVFIQDVVQDDERALYSKAKLKVFYIGETADHRLFTKDFSEKVIETLPLTPVVGFYSEDDEDFVGHNNVQYVYGVVPGWGGASKQFATLGVKEGDIITIVAHKGSRNGVNQAASAFYVSHEAGETPEKPENPSEPETPGDENPYAISLDYTIGANAYDDGVASVNGTENQKVLKIGTSSKVGDITIKVPGSAKTVSFYAVAWKGKATTLEFYAGETLLGEQAIAANDGATGNSPYTITVADSDKYTLDCSALTADTEIKVTTKSGANTRAIFFGIQAN